MAHEKYRGDSFRRSAGSRSARNITDRSCENLVHALAIHIYDLKAPAADLYVIGDRRDTPESRHQKSAHCLKPALLFFRAGKYELVRSFAESARAEISYEDLRKLIESKSLNAEWGGVEFKFPDAALASLKDFISRRISAADIR